MKVKCKKKLLLKQMYQILFQVNQWTSYLILTIAPWDIIFILQTRKVRFKEATFPDLHNWQVTLQVLESGPS